MIRFHGIVNENVAENTGLNEEDIELLIEAIWKGTKGLVTRSKIGHMPRLLLRAEHPANWHIGGLNKKIKLESGVEDEEIRDVGEVVLDITELNKSLKKA